MNALNHTALAWWGWMGPMLVQAGLLILIVSGIDLAIRRWAWPQVRYALWLLVLLKLLIPPGWTLPSALVPQMAPLAASHIPVTLSRPFTAGSRQPVEITRPPEGKPVVTADPSRTAPAAPASSEPEAVPSSASQTRTGPVWQVYALGAWLLGMAGLLGLLVRRMVRLRRWHREQDEKRTIPVWFHELLVTTARRLKLGRLPAVVFSDQAVTPAVYGVFRPVLLLPADYFDGLSEEDAGHVLLHELAHLKRGDLWLHGLCLLLQVVYWFNPLMIWARRQMKHVREICCDLTIANLLREKTGGYRQTLLNTARGLLTESLEPGMGMLGVFEEPFRLVSRLRWLEKATWRARSLMTATALAVAVLMVACVLPMASGGSGVDTRAAAAQGNVPPPHPDEPDISELDFEWTIERTKPLHAAVLPMLGPHSQRDEARERFIRLLERDKVVITGPIFARYFSNSEKVSEDQFAWEVGIPVTGDSEVSPPLEIIRVCPAQVASLRIEGVRETDPVWERFVGELSDAGYVPAVPPAVEIYHSTGDAYWWKTELQSPVFRPEEGYPGMAISIVTRESQPVLVLPMTGSLAQHPEAIARLRAYADRVSLRTAGDMFSLYLTDVTRVPPSLYQWAVGYPVPEDSGAEAPFEVHELEAGTYGRASFPGKPTWEYPWAAFVYHLMIDGYFPAGPAVEIWHETGPKPEWKQGWTEMLIPVIEADDIGSAAAEWGMRLAETITEAGRDGSGSREARSGTRGEKPGSDSGIGEFESEPYRIHLRQTRAFQAVMIRLPHQDQIKKGIDRLRRWLKSAKIRPSGPPFIRQLHNVRIMRPETEQPLEVGYPLPAGDWNPVPPLEIRRFPAGPTAVQYITGEFDEDELNQDWGKWVFENRQTLKEAALIFCPDRKYKLWTKPPHWEIRVGVEAVSRPFPEVEVFTKWREAEAALVLSMRGSYSQEGAALKRLRDHLAETGVEALGPPFFRYLNDENNFPDDQLRWEVGVPVDKGMEARLPFELRFFPERLTGYAEVECRREDMALYVYPIAGRLQSRGYFGIGYPMRILLEGTPEGISRSELQIEVRRKRRMPNTLPIFD